MLVTTDILVIFLMIMFSVFILAIGKIAFSKFVFSDKKTISKEFKDVTFDYLIQKDDNIFPPPISEKTALDILQCWLLGEDWYVPSPISSSQVNTEIVCQILYKYSDEFKKEFDLRRKFNELHPCERCLSWKCLWEK